MNCGEHWGWIEKMFLPKTEIAATFSAAISTVFIENSRHFWECQEKVWHNMQLVADGWFERRRIETQKARETMCRFESFEDLFRTHRDWAIGAFDRIMAETRSGLFGSSYLQELRK